MILKKVKVKYTILHFAMTLLFTLINPESPTKSGIVNIFLLLIFKYWPETAAIYY